MRVFHAVVFDDIVQNTTPIYSDPVHNALLGTGARVSFQAVSNVFTGGPTLTVAVEHSSDGRTWIPRLTTPELYRATLSWTDTNSHVVDYDGTDATGCLVRFRVELGASATVRVKIIACVRRRMTLEERFAMVHGVYSPVQSCGCGAATDEDRSAIMLRMAISGHDPDGMRWLIEGGDDALFDEVTKKSLAELEAMCGCDDGVISTLRAELRREALKQRQMERAATGLCASTPLKLAERMSEHRGPETPWERERHVR